MRVLNPMSGLEPVLQKRKVECFQKVEGRDMAPQAGANKK